MAGTAITMGTAQRQSPRRPQVPRHLNLQTQESEVEKSKLDLVAFGCALSAALVVLLILCEGAAVILPGWPLAHNWLTLFSSPTIINLSGANP